MMNNLNFLAYRPRALSHDWSDECPLTEDGVYFEAGEKG